MHFLNSIVATLLLAGGALAQASSATVNVHVVTVSNSTGKELKFSPNNIKAAVGDMVQFQFMGGNHTVTQSNFANPCVPIHSVMSNVTGFFSGFQPVPAGASSIPTYTIMVSNASPIWFYCSQGKHCQNGMVGAINA
jgi:plastocyanin